MASEEGHFRLRLPIALKKEIEAAAAANNRSLNAEILARLAIAKTASTLEQRMAEQNEEIRQNEKRVAKLEEIIGKILSQIDRTNLKSTV